MNANLSAGRAVQPLALTMAVILLAGCGSGAASVATVATDRAAAATTSSPAPQPPAAPTPSVATTSSAAPAASTDTGSPPATSTTASSGDVTAAVRSALALFEKVSRQPNDPAAGYLWGPASDPTGHLSRDVAARLAALHGSGYFSARVCAADYFTGSQNLLDAAPTVVSANRDASGTVTVVLRRPVTPARPDLTLVMTHRNGVWVATELATGSGPSASIFSAKPNC